MARKNKTITPLEIQQKVLSELSPIISERIQITKKGKAPIKVTLPGDITNSSDAARYYNDLLKLAGFNLLVRNFVFSEVCKQLDYQYAVYVVDEVGYKLSKRKERLRPNQLCRFVGLNTRRETPNLHLANEPVVHEVNLEKPERILDYIRRDVKWI